MACLSPEAIRQYQRDGYFSPIRVLSAAQATGYRERLQGIEKSGRLPAGGLRSKSHLLLTWVDEIVRNREVLDAVEGVIGPDILAWGTSFFIKEPRNASFVSYHQDLTYWGLDPADIVTAWVALAPATLESGAMKFLPGSHTTEILPHKDTFAKDNLLTRGQEVAVEVDEGKLVDVLLQPGEM